MAKRIFLAVNLPTNIRKDLFLFQSELKEAFDKKAVKWVNKDNLHITLLFLGFVKKEKVPFLQKKLSSFKNKKFSVEFDKITYYPENKKSAKIIWAQGKSRELCELREKICKALSKDFPISSVCDEKEFKVHVTMGRIRRWEFEKTSLSAIPEISQEVNLSFDVNSFVLLESKLKKGGAEYKLIEEYKLDE